MTRHVVSEGRRLVGKLINPDGSETGFRAENVTLVLDVKPAVDVEVEPGVYITQPGTVVLAALELNKDERGVAYTLMTVKDGE